MFQYMHYWSIQTLTPIAKKKQHHSINDRLSNNQICIMFENSKKFDRSNIINQLIKPTESNCARYHDVNSMLSNILSYPWYKPASLLYTIVLHECISVPDLESPGGGGRHKYMYMGGSGQRRSCIHIHACMLWRFTFFFWQYNLRRHSLSHLLKFYYSMYEFMYMDLENVFTQRNIFVFIQNYVFSCIKCVFFMLGYMYLFNF